MINVFAQIKSDYAVEDISLPQANKISEPDIMNKVQNPKNPFFLGSTKMYEKGTVLQNKVNYFISDMVSNEEGLFPDNAEITINFEETETPKGFFIIYFDTLNKSHPTSVTVTFYTYTEDNLEIHTETYKVKESAIAIPCGADGVKVKIDNWNKSNSPIVITGITTILDINDIMSLNFDAIDRSNTSKPSWGIKSNSGKISLVDQYGIFDSLNKYFTKTKTQISIFIKSKIRTQEIARFIFDGQTTDSKTMRCDVELKDELSFWQNIDVPQINGYDFDQGKGDILSIIQNICNISNIVLVIDNATKNHLEAFYDSVHYPEIEAGTVWSQFSKICELTASYISCDRDGYPTMHYCGGT